jgi:4-hydroxybenzoyl-CoA reductase subunit beta
MRLPKFEYIEPRSLEEAVSLLFAKPGESCVVSGGTEVYVKLKQRLLAPETVMSLIRIPELDAIRYNQETGLLIGPTVTQGSVEGFPLIRGLYHGLAMAAGSVASPQIRNMGTIGGNICLDTRCWYYNQSRSWRKCRPICFKRGGNVCHVVKVEGAKRCFALFMADTAVMLTALDAKVKLVGPNGSRTVALKDFYTHKGERPNQLKASEILAEIQVPPPPVACGSAYARYADRSAIDFPVLSVAAVLTVEPESNICKDARIVLGGVSPGPHITQEAANALIGKELTDDLIEEASRQSANDAKPVTHMAVPAKFKKAIIPVYVKRALQRALEVAHSS